MAKKLKLFKEQDPGQINFEREYEELVTKSARIIISINTPEGCRDWFDSVLQHFLSKKFDFIHWKQILMHFYYAKKSMPLSVRQNPMFNLMFLERFVIKYFLVLKDLVNVDDETANLMQILQLSFEDHLEQLLNLIILLSIDDFKHDYLKNIFHRILSLQKGRVDTTLSYTRLILCLKKLKYLDPKQKEHPLGDTLPALVPISDEFSNFKRIFGNTQQTSTILKTSFSESDEKVFMSIYKNYMDFKVVDLDEIEN